VIDGLLCLDKPAGPTSHDAVQRVKRLTGAAKAGHTGTLDPFATGVLPILLNRATVLAPFLQTEWKTYRATVSLGRATDTLDPTGRVTDEAPVPPLTAARVAETLAAFVGPRQQTPPKFSAQKVGGVRAYKAARRGEEVALRPKPIVIRSIAAGAITATTIDFDAECSAGTYVRVLAAEIAAALGTVGHLTALRRLAVGPLRVDDALSYDAIADLAATGALAARVLTPDAALASYRRVTLAPRAVAAVLRGGNLSRADLADAPAAFLDGETVRVAAPDGSLIALAAANVAGDPRAPGFRVVRVLALT
jgi:tRNA pseudouridine55 synthase